jgi:hypothetical protein
MEIVKTERSYVANLRIVVQVRLNPPHVSCRVVSCRVGRVVSCVGHSCACSH